MKHLVLIMSSIFIFSHSVISQEKEREDIKILFRGLVIDASTFSPISNSQIMINGTFSSISGVDGRFAFYVNRHDTVIFQSLGYKQALLYVSDTLQGQEFITGIYMNNDTLSIGEVIIVPSYSNIKSEILNAKRKEPSNMDNARYNVAVSAYQGRKSQNILGNPADNYAVISQMQKIDAFEKGGIPSDHIVGFNPLIFLPAAYLLLHGLPENAAPLKPHLTDQEVAQVHKKYLETIRQPNQ
jgi:hypothetical protein